MAFVSFVGRVLFVSVFVLSAWQERIFWGTVIGYLGLICLEFTSENGFNDFGTDGGPATKYLRPKFNVFSRNFSSHTGVKLPEVEIKHLVAAAIALKGIGSLLFIFNSSIGALLLILHQAITTPIFYDFYNYDVEKKEFNQLFVKFTQNLALLGALLFFIGMKNSIPRRSSQVGKKNPKSKTS